MLHNVVMKKHSMTCKQLLGFCVLAANSYMLVLPIHYGIAVVVHVADKAGDDNPHSRQLKTWKTCWKEMMAQERDLIS